MKIILSRKGFDSKTGGKPSIIYNDKFYSFPIPQQEGNGIPYKDLFFDIDKSYENVFENLNIDVYKDSHLDPDLKYDIYKKNEIEWRPLFGQAGTAEAILKKNCVNSGDLFLFFGWFKFAEEDKDGKIKYSYDERYKDGFHAIYGYLEVEKKIDVKETPEKVYETWMNYHPHIVNKDLYNAGRHNGLYISKKNSSLTNNTKKGAGLFKFDNSLILTKKGCSKGVWELDNIFIETDRFKKFQRYNGKEKIDVSLKGYYPQELMISDNAKIVNLAKNLIAKYGE